MLNKKVIVLLLFTLFFGVFGQVSIAETIHEITPSSRVITRVIQGMTINDIIRKIYPQQEALWPEIKEKIIEINPESFHPYSDKLINGARLKLVDIKRIDQQEISSKVKVGYVVRQDGEASVRDANGHVQGLEVKSQIYEGDRITTAVGANLYILMDDGAEIFLKSDSVIKISEYIITSSYGSKSSIVLSVEGASRCPGPSLSQGANTPGGGLGGKVPPPTEPHWESQLK